MEIENRKSRWVAVLLTAALGSCAPSEPRAPFCASVAATWAAVPPSALDLDAAQVSTANLKTWIDFLTRPELRGRRAASQGSDAAAAALAANAAALGLAAPFADNDPGGSYCQAFNILETEDQNVVAHLGGESDRPAVVLVGAHYDGQGVHPTGAVYPSADDNASGVAALFEVARLAARREAQWPFDLVFVAFGAEELGQVGAKVWLAEPSVPLDRLALMINFDMVGRAWPGEPATSIGYLTEGPGPFPNLAAASAASGVAVRPWTELFDEALNADSTVFSPHVPTLFLSTGLHADHHERGDTPERVDLGQIERAVRLVLEILDSLDVG